MLGRRYERILCCLNTTEMGRSMWPLCKTKLVKHMVSSKNQKPNSLGIPKIYLGLAWEVVCQRKRGTSKKRQNIKLYWEGVLNKQLHMEVGLWGGVSDERDLSQDDMISSLIRKSVTLDIPSNTEMCANWISPQVFSIGYLVQQEQECACMKINWKKH